MASLPVASVVRRSCVGQRRVGMLSVTVLSIASRHSSAVKGVTPCHDRDIWRPSSCRPDVWQPSRSLALRMTCTMPP